METGSWSMCVMIMATSACLHSIAHHIPHLTQHLGESDRYCKPARFSIERCCKKSYEDGTHQLSLYDHPSTATSQVQRYCCCCMSCCMWCSHCCCNYVVHAWCLVNICFKHGTWYRNEIHVADTVLEWKKFTLFLCVYV